jgi:hypothetical protein
MENCKFASTIRKLGIERPTSYLNLRQGFSLFHLVKGKKIGREFYFLFIFQTNSFYESYNVSGIVLDAGRKVVHEVYVLMGRQLIIKK